MSTGLVQGALDLVASVAQPLEGTRRIDCALRPGEVVAAFASDLDLVAADRDLDGAIVKREMDPTMAFMMGKLKVAGSMGIAMKLSSVLGG